MPLRSRLRRAPQPTTQVPEARRAAAADRLAASSGEFAARAVQELERLPWFQAFDPEVRSWIPVAIRTGVEGFITWLRDPQSPATSTEQVFDVVPRSASRVVSLGETVDLVRRTAHLYEAWLVEVLPEAEVPWVRETLVRYASEIAFTVAAVYARAAEERGAWGARLEAELVDDLLDGAAARIINARAVALGGVPDSELVVVAARVVSGRVDVVAEQVRRGARRAGLQVVVGARAGSVLIVVPAAGEEAAVRLLPQDAAVVVGPVVPDLASACVSAQEALAGLRALPARSAEHGAPVRARDLLAERLLTGDERARRQLVELAHEPLSGAGGGVLETVSCYLEEAGSIEECARRMFVHPNTVRYRLKRAEELTGLRVTDPHDAFPLRLGLLLGRLATAEESAEH